MQFSHQYCGRSERVFSVDWAGFCRASKLLIWIFRGTFVARVRALHRFQSTLLSDQLEFEIFGLSNY